MEEQEQTSINNSNNVDEKSHGIILLPILATIFGGYAVLFKAAPLLVYFAFFTFGLSNLPYVIIRLIPPNDAFLFESWNSFSLLKFPYYNLILLKGILLGILIGWIVLKVRKKPFTLKRLARYVGANAVVLFIMLNALLGYSHASNQTPEKIVAYCNSGVGEYSQASYDNCVKDSFNALAKKYNIKVEDMPIGIDRNMWAYRSADLKITECLQTKERKINQGFRSDEEYIVFFGFIEFDSEGTLKPVLNGGAKITRDQESNIFNGQEYGILDNGKMQDGESVLIGDHWLIPQYLKVLGYDAKEFYSRFDQHGFDDDTCRCDECGVYNDRDDGCTYNHRYVDDGCTQLGVHCGCYDEYMQSTGALSEYLDNADQCIEVSVAEHHEKSGALKKIQTYIGGMVDGRGGHIHGESVKEGTPESILKTLKAEHPKRQYIFVHEESGQFQTYFSVYEYQDKAGD